MSALIRRHHAAANRGFGSTGRPNSNPSNIPLTIRVSQSIEIASTSNRSSRSRPCSIETTTNASSTNPNAAMKIHRVTRASRDRDGMASDQCNRQRDLAVDARIPYGSGVQRRDQHGVAQDQQHGRPHPEKIPGELPQGVEIGVRDAAGRAVRARDRHSDERQRKGDHGHESSEIGSDRRQAIGNGEQRGHKLILADRACASMTIDAESRSNHASGCARSPLWIQPKSIDVVCCGAVHRHTADVWPY